MLPFRYRIKNGKKINQLFKEGKTLSNDVLVMKVFPQSKDSPSQFSFGVGLKFSKKASKRNLVRRWMREAVRAKIKKIKPGWQVAIVLNSEVSFEKLNHQLILEKSENLLKKAKILQ